MRIMVFAVPAQRGGALTILNQYYKKAIEDKMNEWYFIVSTPNLQEKENIKVLRFPEIKKSWFHRLYFDKFVSHKLVEKYNIDEILSLQNLIISNVNIKQTLYFHQSLPFAEKKYRLTENFKLWIYQNILSKSMFNSIKKADKVIVQTKWMKEVCIKNLKVDEKKFKICTPDFNIKIKRMYETQKHNNKQLLFFYPANGMSYKNHILIVEAVENLKEQKIDNFKIIFTLKGNENKDIKRLYSSVTKNKLPIEFIGNLSLERVYEYYSKSILIFPSYIETFGLPLLEAKLHGTPILASNCEFSHEVLEGYENVRYFNPFNSEELTNILKNILK